MHLAFLQERGRLFPERQIKAYTATGVGWDKFSARQDQPVRDLSGTGQNLQNGKKIY
jgi:hypothetical protein